MKPFLSICMIVKNEENVLRRCLDSIKGIADEIIIADTGSVDQTKDIALEYTDMVFDYTWEDDFSKARNFAASKASGEWIFVIDADEFVDRDSFTKFKEDLKNNPPDYNILAVQIVNFVGINGKDTSLNYHERLYKNDGLISYYRSIHELLKHKESKERRGFSDFQIYHSGYMKSIVNEKEKSTRNLTLLKNKKEKEPIDYYFLGNEYDQLGDLDKAIKYYQKGFQLKDDINKDWVKKLLLRLVNTLHKANRNKEALEIIDSCEQIYPYLVDFKFYRGKIYFDEEDYENAKEVFEEILRKKNELKADSSNDFLEYLPYKLLGEIYESENELHLAVHNYSRALSINDADDYVWSKLINLLAKYSPLDELTEFLNNNLLTKNNITPQKVIKILLDVPDLNAQKLTRSLLDEPELSIDEKEALFIKNLCLDGNTNEVVKIIAEKSPSQIYSLLTKGIFTIIDFIILTIELQSQEYQKILYDIKFDKSIDNLFHVLFNKKHKKIDEFEEELFVSIVKQANILGWGTVINHLNSKMKYLSLNTKTKLKKMEKQVAKNGDPHYVQYEKSQENIDSNRKKEIEELKKDIENLLSNQLYEEALTIVDESLKFAPSHAELYSIKAVILINIQQLDRAKEVLEKGLEIDPNHVDCLYNLAYIHEQAGYMVLAINLYKKILYLTHEKELINEIKGKVHQALTILRQKEMKKRLENSKFAKKQDLVLKDEQQFNKRLHIVYMLTHVGICGGVKIILEHANRLTKLGVKVSLVCHFPKPTWYPVEANYIEVPFDVELTTGIPECDVIVATYWDHIQSCIDTKIAPVVYFEQGDFHLFDYENMDENLKKFIYQQYQLPKFILTVSNQAAKIIKTVYNRESKVIYNAVDTDIFNHVDKKSSSENTPYMLMMGDAQIKFKGIDHIIEAYKKVKNEIRDIRLFWITPTTPPNNYVSEVDEFFVNPSQRKIAELYSGASLFVSASYYESFSLPVLEAMACGCPVVTTENTGVLEYAKDNENVLMTKIGDSNEIYKKIVKVLRSNGLKKKLITNGLSIASKFNWDNILFELQNLYKEVASYKVKNDQNDHTVMGTNSKLSVILTVYNSEKFLRKTIESILNQTYKNFELIIVNDGSTDSSENIIKSFEDARIKYIFQENTGVADARNKGLDFAKGDFITFHDSDDLSVPNRFELILKQFDNYNIGAVHSDMLLINEMDNPIGYWQSKNIEKDKLLRYFIKIGTPFNNPTIIYKKETVGSNRFDTKLKIGEDTKFVLNVLRNSNTLHVAEPLLLYRRHANNSTNNNNYDTLFAHVNSILKGISLKKLLPELEWEKYSQNFNMARAKTIVSYYLYRRGMHREAQTWINEALYLSTGVKNTGLEDFIFGIGNIINKNYKQAITFLSRIVPRDHIVENFLGEIYGFNNDTENAMKHFLNAIKYCPNYPDAIDNLKSLGGINNHNFIDTTFKKYINYY